MCGRFTLHSNLAAIMAEFGVTALPLLEPRYNIAPTQPVAALRQNEPGARECVLFRWGLVPSWADDLKIGNRMINARAETVADKPSFRSAFKRRRCVVLADGYYEWKKEGARKQPFYIRLRDGHVFGMAGLWECWHAPDGSPIETCTVITTDANELTRSVHDRMPVILDHDTVSDWLAPNAERTQLEALLRPYFASRMEAYPVRTIVNSPTHDGPDCVERAPSSVDG